MNDQKKNKEMPHIRCISCLIEPVDYYHNVNLMIECKEHRQWLDQKTCPIHRLSINSHGKNPKVNCQNMQEGITQVVANEQALAKLKAKQGSPFKNLLLPN